MKRKLLLALLSILLVSLVGCKSNNQSNESIDDSLNQIEESLNEEEKDSLDELGSESNTDYSDFKLIGISVIEKTENKAGLSVVFDTFEHSCNSWGEFKSNYKFTITSDYYGEITELNGMHDGFFYQGMFPMYIPLPSEFPYTDYKYNITIEDKESNEVVFTQDITLTSDDVATKKDPVYDIAFNAIKDKRISNTIDYLDFSVVGFNIEQVQSGGYTDHAYNLVTKVKNNTDTLFRVPILRMTTPNHDEYFGFQPNVSAIKPGEEIEIIFTYNASTNMLETFKELAAEDILPYMILRDDENNMLFILDDGKILEAIKNY